MRIGQKNGRVRPFTASWPRCLRHADRCATALRWAQRGTRPRQPADQRYQNAYVFGAVCPARDTGAAIVMPHADTNAMQEFLDEMTRYVAPGARAALLVDQIAPRWSPDHRSFASGSIASCDRWHTTKALGWPDNITPFELPPRSPELNPQENIWQYLRQTWLSNRLFETYEEVVDAACDAWIRLTREAGRIRSIATRQWAKVGG